MSLQDQRLDMAYWDLPKQYLISAFLAMEPPDCLISLARKCGGGLISEDVQEFLWVHCINRGDENCHTSYLKSFLKKLIREIESTGGNVMDEFYERYACYMAFLKEDEPGNGKSWIVKCISFLFHDVPSHLGQIQMVVPLQCSLNMLQGDTGCALWPSSLFLSEFILSFPQVFTRKSCFEVGSGVGLIGVCLQHVKASQVILTDGDASSLENLKLNLEMNKIGNVDASSNITTGGLDVVKCIHLPWESAKEDELQQFMPDIVLGADVIYDPSCLPHLVRVLTLLLNRRKVIDQKLNGDPQGIIPSKRSTIMWHKFLGDVHGNNEEKDHSNGSLSESNNNTTHYGSCHSEVWGGHELSESDDVKLQAATMESLAQEMKSAPVALIASVIRNVDTFKCFLNLCFRNNLLVRDLTESIRLFNLLPYMTSYNRSDVHLFLLSYSSN